MVKNIYCDNSFRPLRPGKRSGTYQDWSHSTLVHRSLQVKEEGIMDKAKANGGGPPYPPNSLKKMRKSKAYMTQMSAPCHNPF